MSDKEGCGVTFSLSEFRRLAEGRTPGPCYTRNCDGLTDWGIFSETYPDDERFDLTDITHVKDTTFWAFCSTHADSIIAELTALRKVADAASYRLKIATTIITCHCCDPEVGFICPDCACDDQIDEALAAYRQLREKE